MDSGPLDLCQAKVFDKLHKELTNVTACGKNG